MTHSSVVLISGGTRGIGAAIARRLASDGHRVAVTSRRGDAPPPSPGVRVLPLDVTDPGSVDRCVSRLVVEEGRIDAVVNNAGYDLYGAAEETSMAEFTAQIDTNLMGAIRLSRAVLPHMRAQRRGRIVQIGSLGGRVALPFNSAYAASKFGLEGFSEALRQEVRPFGIHVTVIEPAAVATDTLDTSIVEAAGRLVPYGERRAAMVGKMRHDGENSGLTPEDVAQTVLRAVVHPAPPLRMPVGGQARAVPLMQALLPQRAFEAMMSRLFP